MNVMRLIYIVVPSVQEVGLSISISAVSIPAYIVYLAVDGVVLFTMQDLKRFKIQYLSIGVSPTMLQ